MKKTLLSTLFIILAAMLLPGIAQAEQTIVKNGKATARIVTDRSDAVNLQAAELLQDFVKRISGASIDIVDGKAKRGDVVIGEGSTDGLTEDGFRLQSCGDVL